MHSLKIESGDSRPIMPEGEASESALKLFAQKVAAFLAYQPKTLSEHRIDNGSASSADLDDSDSGDWEWLR